MVTVTRRAKEQLKELLESGVDDSTVGLRLDTMPTGQLDVFADHAHADDQVVVHEGAVVLLVGQEVAETLGRATLDYEESETGAQFVIKAR
jgi:Fe-S cluster assembly iron-binding protein IscA